VSTLGKSSKLFKVEKLGNNMNNKYLLSLFAASFLVTSLANAGSIGSGGVSKADDGGSKSSAGYTIYYIKCNSGSGGAAFQKPDGYWYDDGGSNYGDSYRNLSLSEFANKACS